MIEAGFDIVKSKENVYLHAADVQQTQTHVYTLQWLQTSSKEICHL